MYWPINADAIFEDGKLYGLGSNDAGGPLVSLLACFLHFYNETDLKFNLIFAATAEEEISGKNGVEILLPKLGEIYFGIVGEPTKMDIAIAEKGLLVIDCVAHGSNSSIPIIKPKPLTSFIWENHSKKNGVR